MFFLEKIAVKIIWIPGWSRLIFCMICGALAALGQAPYHFMPLCFVSFTLFVWLLDGIAASASMSRGIRAVWFFIAGCCLGWGYFIVGSLEIGRFGFEPPEFFSVLSWIISAAVLIFPAMFFGIGVAMAGLVWNNGTGRIAALALGIGFSEYLREYLLADCFSNPVGFLIMPFPVLMQSVQLVGIAGMNMLAVFLFSVPAVLAFQRYYKFVALLWGLLAFSHVVFGFFVISNISNSPVSSEASFLVRIVQPNIDDNVQKQEKDRGEILKTLLNLSNQTGSINNKKIDLVIWPETFSSNPLTEQADILAAAGKVAGEAKFLLTRFVKHEKDNEIVNFYDSVALINEKGHIVETIDAIYPFLVLKIKTFGDFFSQQDIGVWWKEFHDAILEKNFRMIDVGKDVKVIARTSNKMLFMENKYFPMKPRVFIVNLGKYSDIGRLTSSQAVHRASIQAVAWRMPVLQSSNAGPSMMINPQGYIVKALKKNKTGILDIDVGAQMFSSGFSFWNTKGEGL